MLNQTRNSFVPARPRNRNPEDENYESEEEYNAWAQGGENEARFENQPMIEPETDHSGDGSSGGGLTATRKGDISRRQMNLTGAKGSSILTS